LVGHAVIEAALVGRRQVRRSRRGICRGGWHRIREAHLGDKQEAVVTRFGSLDRFSAESYATMADFPHNETSFR
jgi:hypothetical protein